MRLVKPTLEYRDTYLAGMSEIIAEHPGLVSDHSIHDLADQIARWELLAAREHDAARMQYWLMDGNEYVGTVQIRREPNGRLPELASHLGWFLRPTRRNDETAKELLSLALTEAAALGMSEVLVTGSMSDRNMFEQRGGKPAGQFTMPDTGRIVFKYSFAL